MKPKPLMWLIAVVYPLGTVLTAVLMMRNDPFSIFDRYYLFTTVFIIPPALICVATWLGTFRHAPNWGWTLVLILWIAVVGYLHYTFIGIASGGV